MSFWVDPANYQVNLPKLKAHCVTSTDKDLFRDISNVAKMLERQEFLLVKCDDAEGRRDLDRQGKLLRIVLCQMLFEITERL